VDQDTDFFASGSYTAVNPTGQRVHLLVNLLDESVPLTASAYLFRNTQTCIGTPNEAFTLGLSGGDKLLSGLLGVAIRRSLQA
jgi:hypothetical protein